MSLNELDTQLLINVINSIDELGKMAEQLRAANMIRIEHTG